MGSPDFAFTRLSKFLIMGALLSCHFIPTPPAPLYATAFEFIGPRAFLLPFVAFFCAQCVIYHTTAVAFPRMFPRAPPLDAHATRSLSSFLASALHHLIVVPISLYALVHFASGRGVAWGALAATPALSLAYLLMDFAFYVVPEAVGGTSYEYLLHHVAGLAVAVAVLASPPALLRWVPVLLVCEASSIPFCASYVLRKAGPPFSTGGAALAMEGLFVTLFTATRVLHLPLAVGALSFAEAHAGDRALVGRAGLAVLWVLCAMQVAWFSQIATLVAATLRGKKKEKVDG